MTKLVRSAVLAMGLLAVGCGDDDDQETFTATLSGANEVPANSSTAGGGTSFTFEGDRVRFALEVENLTAVTMAHIHSGATGVNGPVRVFLFNGPQTTVGARRVLAEGSFGAADVTGISFQDLLQEMRGGGAYVNVHTAAIPTGEIRGQVRVVD
jgi:hypothetical protein